MNIDTYYNSFNGNLSSKRQRLDIPAVVRRKESFPSIGIAVERFLERYHGLLKHCMTKSGLDEDMTNDNNPIFIVFMSRAWDVDSKIIKKHQPNPYVKYELPKEVADDYAKTILGSFTFMWYSPSVLTKSYI